MTFSVPACVCVTVEIWSVHSIHAPIQQSSKRGDGLNTSMGIERKRREELVSINKSVCQAVIKKQREVRTTENAACKHT